MHIRLLILILELVVDVWYGPYGEVLIDLWI
jgi:hypothetical protein